MITNVTLIDGVADAPVTKASVVVRGDRIEAVYTEGRYRIPVGAEGDDT